MKLRDLVLDELKNGPGSGLDVGERLLRRPDLGWWNLIKLRCFGPPYSILRDLDAKGRVEVRLEPRHAPFEYSFRYVYRLPAGAGPNRLNASG